MLCAVVGLCTLCCACGACTALVRAISLMLHSPHRQPSHEWHGCLTLQANDLRREASVAKEIAGKMRDDAQSSRIELDRARRQCDGLDANNSKLQGDLASAKRQLAAAEDDAVKLRQAVSVSCWGDVIADSLLVSAGVSQRAWLWSTADDTCMGYELGAG